ncbi:hypothetical protein CORC01_14211 [Colletotrichum orchidophilum]|uniref:Uncharacterized protein n=1 Tax=Colletotrichum orchidophilum TaxID=1209926 RepID=A0A1G4AN20_9PEZI|nr:uncharacterized protein CORC01_14211 [Colletotrichum orchidophilum]OHE90496.1 hypothetical protein CORC01_14211 [Colletotrichum orchidophilum]
MGRRGRKFQASHGYDRIQTHLLNGGLLNALESLAGYYKFDAWRKRLRLNTSTRLFETTVVAHIVHKSRPRCLKCRYGAQGLVFQHIRPRSSRASLFSAISKHQKGTSSHNLALSPPIATALPRSLLFFTPKCGRSTDERARLASLSSNLRIIAPILRHAPLLACDSVPAAPSVKREVRLVWQLGFDSHRRQLVF